MTIRLLNCEGQIVTELELERDKAPERVSHDNAEGWMWMWDYVGTEEGIAIYVESEE